MTISIDLMIPYILECLIFIYYTSSMMRPRKNEAYANIAATSGYVLLFGISLYNIPTLNAVSFTLMNFAVIYIAFVSGMKNAIFHALMLTVIMMLTEGLLAFIMNIGIYNYAFLDMSASARNIHAVLSKMLYFTGVILTKYISKQKRAPELADSHPALLFIPAFTIMSLVGFMAVIEHINENERMFFTAVSVMGMAANIITYWIYDRAQMYHKELRDLQEQNYKSSLELNYCNMLEDKLEEERILRHDFKEHLRILENHIKADDNLAMEYLQTIKAKNEETSIANYSNNRILNLLLSEKQKICREKGIELKIHVSEVELDFIKDIDLVSIFSNLMNNAIESCDRSEKKIIYMNLYKMNKAFMVIKIENGCDVTPVEEDGFYKSTKVSNEDHGIGLKSVSKALNTYNGDLRMQYDAKDKMFSTVVMVPLK